MSGKELSDKTEPQERTPEQIATNIYQSMINYATEGIQPVENYIFHE